jgi:glycosyltransferase involved in cell wall biosynthesis
VRIGVLTTSYPRARFDPAGLFVAGFARFLARQGASVEVLCAGALGAPGAEQEPAGPRVTRLGYFWPRALERLFYHGGAPEALEAAPVLWVQAACYSGRLLQAARARAAGWDAVVSHWLVPAGVVGRLVGAGRPHLAIAHSGDVHLLGRLGRAGAALAAAFDAPATRVVFAAAAVRDRFAALAPRVAARGGVVPMGVDVAALGYPGGRVAARAVLGLAADAFVILFLGRLVPIKGLDRLLAAAGDRPGTVVLVAGDGPLRPALEAGAPAGVRFLGEVRGRARSRLLAAADVLCLPSCVLPGGRAEGSPTAILEAHAAGLPVVATRSGGVAELVCDGEDGLLVPPGEAAALGAALARLAADAALRTRLAAAAARTGAAHDWEVVGPQLMALLPRASVGRARHPT